MAPLSGFPAGATAIKTILVTLAIVAMALRGATFRIRKRPVKSHDYLCFLSLVSLLDPSGESLYIE